jgi:hypothetical protein
VQDAHRAELTLFLTGCAKNAIVLLLLLMAPPLLLQHQSLMCHRMAQPVLTVSQTLQRHIQQALSVVQHTLTMASPMAMTLMRSRNIGAICLKIRVLSACAYHLLLMARLELTLQQHLQQTRIFVEVYSKPTTQQAQGHDFDATAASFKHGHTIPIYLFTYLPK